MKFLKTIKTAKLSIKLSDEKVIRIEELKNGNYAVIFEGIDINKINFSKLKELWKCFKGLVETDTEPKPDSRLISWEGPGMPKRRKINGIDEEVKLIRQKINKSFVAIGYGEKHKEKLPRPEVIPSITLERYLDKYIRYWRGQRSRMKTKSGKSMAIHYIDTYQSVRVSILGELLPEEKIQLGCKCQDCGNNFKVDLTIPDDLWEKIKPLNKPKGAGLLCGKCIMEKIEEISDYDYWVLTKKEE